MNLKNKILATTVSAALLTGASLWEGTVFHVYLDSGGVPTYCTGETQRPIWGKTYTAQECSSLLSSRLKEHGEGVVKCINQPMKQNEYDAFTLMAYNVGVKGFCGSTTVLKFNQGDSTGACRAMAYTPSGGPNWSFDNGKYVQGLHNRRKYEMKMCLGEPL